MTVEHIKPNYTCYIYIQNETQAHDCVLAVHLWVPGNEPGCRHKTVQSC